MSGTEFRDAIADVVQTVSAGWVLAPGMGRLDADDVAREVLAMPEMQAIRQALLCVPWSHFTRLPESVVAWVLDGDE